KSRSFANQAIHHGYRKDEPTPKRENSAGTSKQNVMTDRMYNLINVIKMMRMFRSFPLENHHPRQIVGQAILAGRR
ncbi:MAG: hypothetical protein KDK33_15060, partial [Leptospiraceae bacterium]|nr:hypothetical protein [Leptospiraceae bacterium]